VPGGQEQLRKATAPAILTATPGHLVGCVEPSPQKLFAGHVVLAELFEQNAPWGHRTDTALPDGQNWPKGHVTGAVAFCGQLAPAGHWSWRVALGQNEPWAHGVGAVEPGGQYEP